MLLKQLHKQKKKKKISILQGNEDSDVLFSLLKCAMDSSSVV